MTGRRTDDPEHFDAAQFRRDEPTLRLGYKEASLSVKGISVFLSLGILALVVSIFFSGYQTQEAIRGLRGDSIREHVALRIAQDRTSCILTMTQEDRSDFRRRYQVGAFKQTCPWIEE